MSPAKRRGKGDGSLFKRSDGMWVGRVELPIGGDGKRRPRSVSSRDRNEAMRKLKKLRAEVEAGQLDVSSSTTVEKWLDHWLEDVHKRRVRPGTFTGDERIIRLHVKPHIGRKRLDKLTPAHVLQMHDAIESDRNAQAAHGLLQQALKDAERQGVVTRNVALLVDKPHYSAAEKEPLTAEQATQLLKSTENDPLYSRWMAALLLGARQGELLGLQWSRVDLVHGVVDFSWQLQQLTMTHGCGERHSDGRYPCGFKRPTSCPQKYWDFPRWFEHKVLDKSLVMVRPKTKKRSENVVPLPGPLWEELKKHHATTINAHNPHDLVWYDGTIRDRYRDRKDWHLVLKRAGLPAAPLHVARHTSATLLALAGVPEEIRMAILGHAGKDMARLYAHTSAAVELQRSAMDSAFQKLLP